MVQRIITSYSTCIMSLRRRDKIFWSSFINLVVGTINILVKVPEFSGVAVLLIKNILSLQAKFLIQMWSVHAAPMLAKVLWPHVLHVLAVFWVGQVSARLVLMLLWQQFLQALAFSKMVVLSKQQWELQERHYRL